jgi:hypothetical protein
MLRLRQRRPKDNPNLILSFLPFTVHPAPFNADIFHSMLFGASCPANFIALAGHLWYRFQDRLKQTPVESLWRYKPPYQEQRLESP